MKKIIFLFYLLIANQLFAQITFEKAYRKLPSVEVARSVDLDGKGGYVIAAGEKSINSLQSVNVLYRINAYGDTLWYFTYAIDNNANFQFVRRSIDGNYYIAGIETDSSTNNTYMWWIMKVDSSGNFIWKKNYLNPSGGFGADGNAFKIKPDGSSLLFIGGPRSLNIDSLGNLINIKIYPNFFNNQLYHYNWKPLLEDSVFYYYAIHPNPPNPPSHKTMKLNYSGDTISTTTLQIDSSGDYLDLLKRVNKNYLLCSYSSFTINGRYLFTLTKLDSSGNKLWNKFTYGYTGIPTSMVVLKNGTNVVCGMPNTNGVAPPGGRAFIYCFNDDGDSLWHKRFSPSDTTSKTELYDVIATPDSGLLAVGQILFSNGQQKSYVVKLNANGDLFNPLSIIERKNETYLHLYPNPAKTYTSIHYMGTEKNAVLTIMNLHGQVIYSQKITSNEERININTEQFGAGFYLCTVRANCGTLANKKLVVMN